MGGGSKTVRMRRVNFSHIQYMHVRLHQVTHVCIEIRKNNKTISM